MIEQQILNYFTSQNIMRAGDQDKQNIYKIKYVKYLARNNEELFDKFIQENRNFFTKNKILIESLFKLVKENDISIVRTLIKYNANLDVYDKNNTSLLAYSIEYNNIEMFELLYTYYSRYIDVLTKIINTVDKYNHNLLTYICQHTSIYIIDINIFDHLVRLTTDINNKNSQNLYPLHAICMKYGDIDDYIKVLVKHGKNNEKFQQSKSYAIDLLENNNRNDLINLLFD